MKRTPIWSEEQKALLLQETSKHRYGPMEAHTGEVNWKAMVASKHWPELSNNGTRDVSAVRAKYQVLTRGDSRRQGKRKSRRAKASAPKLSASKPAPLSTNGSAPLVMRCPVCGGPVHMVSLAHE